MKYNVTGWRTWNARKPYRLPQLEAIYFWQNKGYFSLEQSHSNFFLLIVIIDYKTFLELYQIEYENKEYLCFYHKSVCFQNHCIVIWIHCRYRNVSCPSLFCPSSLISSWSLVYIVTENLTVVMLMYVKLIFVLPDRDLKMISFKGLINLFSMKIILVLEPFDHISFSLANLKS